MALFIFEIFYILKEFSYRAADYNRGNDLEWTWRFIICVFSSLFAANVVIRKPLLVSNSRQMCIKISFLSLTVLSFYLLYLNIYSRNYFLTPKQKYAWNHEYNI